MKIFKFLLSFGLTVVLFYFMHNRLDIDGNKTPAPGKFLSPFNGFWANSNNLDIPFSSELNIEGLQEPVNVYYDKNLIPHIYANNMYDLYMAQGFVVAQLRLWQLEFQTHAAAGRLSEIVGPATIPLDRAQRRKGLPIAAQKAYEAVKADKEVNEYTDAYAKGVNAYIQQLSRADLPLEYKILNYEPEEWTPYKSALILAYMIENLTGRDRDIENTLSLNHFGREDFDIMFPDFPKGIDPTIPSDSSWSFTPSAVIPPTKIPYPTADIQNFLDKPDPDNGSNNWAIAPSKSSSGNAILANDTHLNLSMPSLWVMMHLHAPGLNVYGYTFTGAPGITIGFNENIAWGFTNAPRDTRDWYNIKFKDSTRTSYWYNNTWKDSEIKVEHIRVRGAEDVMDTVVHTTHGPVVYEKGFLGNNLQHNLALRWTGHETSNTLKALVELNRATSLEDYQSAIQYWDSPPQNIVFASTDGDIALTVQGKYPLKWTEQGKFIMDGSDPAMEWQGYIPKKHSAAQVNPDRGFVSSANQHSVDATYPYYFYQGSLEYFRNRRINSILQSKDKFTLSEMKDMQSDALSIKAQEILPLMLASVPASANGKEVLNALQSWDYVYRAENKTAVYFDMWWRTLYTMVWDEFQNLDYKAQWPNAYNTIQILKTNPDYKYLDIQSTTEVEKTTDLIQKSFMIVLEEVEKWENEQPLEEQNWGFYKNTTIRHLMRLPAFSEYAPTISGHADAINSTKGSHGPSQRLIVEMSSPPKAYGILPGGQSGNPGSYYYSNMLPDYIQGNFIALSIEADASKSRANAVFSQTLKPNN